MVLCAVLVGGCSRGHHIATKRVDKTFSPPPVQLDLRCPDVNIARYIPGKGVEYIGLESCGRSAGYDMDKGGPPRFHTPAHVCQLLTTALSQANGKVIKQLIARYANRTSSGRFSPAFYCQTNMPKVPPFPGTNAYDDQPVDKGDAHG